MPINLATTAISALYLGSTAISTAYLGSTEVYTSGGDFDPVDLFASGEAGALFLPSDTTCYTDTAGTTAAGAGDAVARIDDGSGNGNHATQATAASRPILRQTGGGLWYLEFDGAADHLIIDSGFSPQATEIWSYFAAFDLTAPSTDNAHVLLSADSGANQYGINNSTSTFVTATRDFENGSLGTPNAIRLDGVDGTNPITYDAGAAVGYFELEVLAGSANQHEIGNNQNGSNHFIGYLYGMVIRGASCTSGEISDTETFLADRSGVTL